MALARAVCERGLSEKSSVHPRFADLLGRGSCIGKNYFDVARGDPGYLMDLRAKRHAEPSRYFMENAMRAMSPEEATALAQELEALDSCTRDLLRNLELEADGPAFSFRSYVAGFADVDVAAITHTLYFYVNVLGSWCDAVALATAVLDTSADFSIDRRKGLLFEASGQALAIGALDPRARVAWAKAKASFPPGFDRFFLFLRIATVELKRFHDEEGYRCALDGAGFEAANLSQAGHSTQDEQFAAALVANLDAFYSLRQGELQRVWHKAEFALKVMNSVSNTDLTLEPLVADRYRIMVMINYGLLQVGSGALASAARTFDEAVLLARNREPNSIAETLSVAGCLQVMRRDYAGGRSRLEEAALLYAVDVRPTSFKTLCRLLALSHEEEGDSQKASFWLNRAKVHAWVEEGG